MSDTSISANVKVPTQSSATQILTSATNNSKIPSIGGLCSMNKSQLKSPSIQISTNGLGQKTSTTSVQSSLSFSSSKSTVLVNNNNNINPTSISIMTQVPLSAVTPPSTNSNNLQSKLFLKSNLTPMNSKKSSQKQNQSNLTSSSKSKLSTFHNQNSNIARIAPFKPKEEAETLCQDRKIIRFNDDIEEISAAETPRHGSLFENGGENVDEYDNDRELGFDDDLENEINLDDNDEEFQKFLNSDLTEDRLV